MLAPKPERVVLTLAMDVSSAAMAVCALACVKMSPETRVVVACDTVADIEKALAESFAVSVKTPAASVGVYP